MERQSLPAQWLHHQTINTQWQSFIVTTMIVLLCIFILITLKYNSYITGENTFEPIPRVGGIQLVVAIKERRGFGEQLLVVTLPTISKMVSPYSWGFSIWTVWVFSISLLPVFSNALHLYCTHRLPGWCENWNKWWQFQEQFPTSAFVSLSRSDEDSVDFIADHINVWTSILMQATQIIWCDLDPKNCSELEM